MLRRLLQRLSAEQSGLRQPSGQEFLPGTVQHVLQGVFLHRPAGPDGVGEGD
jgi:hypothetical protein